MQKHQFYKIFENKARQVYFAWDYKILEHIKRTSLNFQEKKI